MLLWLWMVLASVASGLRSTRDNFGDLVACADAGHWALTFDDGPGPGPSATALVLDELKARGVLATFFVVGVQLVSSSETESLLKRAFEEGHQIAMHMWSHPHLPELTNDEIVDQVTLTGDAVFAAIGQRPRYVRPPYGEINDRVRAVLVDVLGLEVVMWGLDTNDWRIPDLATYDDWNPPAAPGMFRDSEEVLRDVDEWMATAEFNGSISLEHDRWPKTAMLSGGVLERVIRRGYEVVTVERCVDGPPAYLSGRRSGSKDPPPRVVLFAEQNA